MRINRNNIIALSLLIAAFVVGGNWGIYLLGATCGVAIGDIFATKE